MTTNQQAIVDASTKLLADIFSQFTGTPEEWITYLTASATKAFAAQTTKAPALQIVTDIFAEANAVAAEIGNPKIVTLIDDLQNTEQDGVNDKIFSLVGDLVADFKALKAL